MKYCDIFGVRVVEVSKGNGGEGFDFMQINDCDLFTTRTFKCQKVMEG